MSIVDEVNDLSNWVDHSPCFPIICRLTKRMSTSSLSVLMKLRNESVFAMVNDWVVMGFFLQCSSLTSPFLFAVTTSFVIELNYNTIKTSPQN